MLDDKGTPEIIRNHIIDSLQYALRNHGQIFTSKEVEWLAGWDDAALEATSLPSRAKAKLPPSRVMSDARKPMLSKTNQWMLAVAVIIFLAAAIFAAVIAR